MDELADFRAFEAQGQGFCGQVLRVQQLGAGQGFGQGQEMGQCLGVFSAPGCKGARGQAFSQTLRPSKAVQGFNRSQCLFGREGCFVKKQGSQLKDQKGHLFAARGRLEGFTKGQCIVLRKRVWLWVCMWVCGEGVKAQAKSEF